MLNHNEKALNKKIEYFVKAFDYVDFLVITDAEGYIKYYKTYKNLGNIKIENPVGLHILKLHQNLNEETSTIMRALKYKLPVLEERQFLNIYANETTIVQSTTFPIEENGEIIGAIDINTCIDPTDEKTNNDIEKSSSFYIDNIITNSPKMLKLKEKIMKAAKTDSPVMVYGETGTGKEMVSHSIHNLSKRKDKPLIVQNCSAVPLGLGESIFFGTTKGSFTGAENRMGLFEMADGGTLVFDELNSMNIELQPKILRTVENQSVRRVGSSNKTNIDVRIISTLNEEPIKIISHHKIRNDLFYRLGVVFIRIPPLRERKEDIYLLTKYFISMYNRLMSRNIEEVDNKVIELFMDYQWPGNVRELKNVIESAFNFAEGEIIKVDNLPNYLTIENKSIGNQIIGKEFCLLDEVKDFEVKFIKLALEKSNTLNEAAKMLNITRQTLKYKIDKYHIEVNIKN